MNRRRLSRTLVFPLWLIVAALLIAACGASKKPPTGSSGATPGSTNSTGTPGSGIKAAYHYSACMRTHGVTNFQDPKVRTHGDQVSVTVHVDPAITGSRSFKSAQKACAHLLPNGGNGPTPGQQRARTEAILAFARCMRQHGFSKFPDPTSQGQLTPEMLTKAGIDLQQPAIKPAAYACLPLTHGLLTKAEVNQAVANPNGGSQSSSGAG